MCVCVCVCAVNHQIASHCWGAVNHQIASRCKDCRLLAVIRAVASNCKITGSVDFRGTWRAVNHQIASHCNDCRLTRFTTNWSQKPAKEYYCMFPAYFLRKMSEPDPCNWQLLQVDPPAGIKQSHDKRAELGEDGLYRLLDLVCPAPI